MNKIQKKEVFWGLVAGSIIAYTIIMVKVNTMPKPVPTCREVGAGGHLYRGQCLAKDYKPVLLPLSPRASWLNTEQQLDIKAKVMFEQMIADAESEGICLVVSSGYRSEAEQAKILEETPAERKNLVAKPNESEHLTGLAVDFVACPMIKGVRNDGAERMELKNEFDTLPEYRWLVDNAHKYGIEQSYTVENIAESQYPVESWHWKFIVKEAQSGK